MKGIVRNGLITKVRTNGNVKRNEIKGKLIFPYMDDDEIIGMPKKELHSFRGQAKIAYKKGEEEIF